ncbi:MAG: sulfite exporter TauE/SafE family protein [bacterium]|nr:sulfite exporter TauE/SafE family protein [bacterium]
MDIIEILKIGGVMMLGCLVQGSSGFGFGLFAIPLLLFFGFDLASTVTMVIIGSAIQKVTAVHYLKDELDWKAMIPFMIAGFAALPLGIYAMFKVSGMAQSPVKGIIGGLVLVMLLLRWLGSIKSRETVPKVWSYVAGFFSGLLNGFANIGGPPLVLWILAHQWSNKKMRATAIAFALIFVPIQLPLMLLAFGKVIVTPMLNILLLTPIVLLGTWLGLKIGEKISKEHLKRYMEGLLLIIALLAIGKSVIG